MRQKREQFQKQIRRQTLEQIFKNKRKIYFNYSPQIHLSKQTIDQIMDECNSEFMRYTNQIATALRQQNQDAIYTAVKESSELLQRLLNKSEHNPDCLKFIVSNWFNLGFYQLMFQSVKAFTGLGKNAFSSLRKETYKWAVYHFYLVYEYQAAYDNKLQNYDEIFSFLFLTMTELQNQPNSLMQIIVLLNSIMFSSPKARHQFFFLNRVVNTEDNFQKICFQHIISAMFYNKERLRLVLGSYQLTKFLEIKCLFIELFNYLCFELQDLEKYVKRKQNSQKQHASNLQKKTVDLYQKTLQLAGYPSKILLKKFLDKQHIIILYEIIKELKSFSFDHWPEDMCHQENLANSLQAFRFFIEFYPNKKIINEFQNELQFLLSLLTSRDVGVLVKNETISLIDMIVYLDQENEQTDFLIRHQNLFQRVWSYDEPNILHIKLNFLNNLLLTEAGFDVVMKYINEISIVLMETKHVHQALMFCNNYFLRTEYQIDSSSKFGVVISILYSLSGEKFQIKDIELDFYILAHLYENGFQRDLPNRYQEWRKQPPPLAEIHKKNGNNILEAQSLIKQKQTLIDRVLMLRNQFLSSDGYPMDE